MDAHHFYQFSLILEDIYYLRMYKSVYRFELKSGKLMIVFSKTTVVTV